MGSSSEKAGIGFVGALQLIFVAFRLANVISWPWWKVFLPFICTGALSCVLCCCTCLAMTASESLDDKKTSRDGVRPTATPVVAVATTTFGSDV